MLLSDWLLFVDKTIIALSGGHFEYFLSFPKKITLVYGLVRKSRIPVVSFSGSSLQVTKQTYLSMEVNDQTGTLIYYLKDFQILKPDYME
jgi:hypothetical protein